MLEEEEDSIAELGEQRRQAEDRLSDLPRSFAEAVREL